MSTDGRHILLTGATGNLGAFALRRFLDAGHRVTAISRSRRNAQIATGRVVRCLSVFGKMAPERLRQLSVIRADITDAAEIGAVRVDEPVDETWHFASSLKYMPKDREELIAVNIDGMRNVLSLHARSAAADARLFYVSTAYVGGKGALRLPEAPIMTSNTRAFHNDYEWTKHEAEEMVSGWCRTGRIQGTTFRPSIIVADNRTLRLVNYTGFYLGVRLFRELGQHLARAGERGPVRLFARPENEINLIPLDHAIEAMMRIADRSELPNGAVFNVVNGLGVTVREAIQVISHVLNMPIEVCDPRDNQPRPKNRHEKMIAYGMTYTLPYVTDCIDFETSCTTAALGQSYRFNVYPEYLHRATKAYVDSLATEKDAGRA